jgi:serine/threonine protein kinase
MARLSSMSCDVLLKSHIGTTLGSFWTEGSNGQHLCLVLPLLGPRVCAEDISTIQPKDWIRIMHDAVSTRKSICFQITQGLRFLHSQGISHGDLRPQNILMQYDGIDQLSELELKALIPSPCPVTWPLDDNDGHTSACAPKYLPPMNHKCFERFLVPKIAIVDFGLIYNSSNDSPLFGLPCDFAAPEVLFWGPKRAIGVSTDIWALACTIFTVMSGGYLFSAYVDATIAELEIFMGSFPEPYRSDWEDRWYVILEAWGRKPQNAEEFWSQSPPPGQAQAPLTVYNHSITELKKQWESETGYSDAIRCRLARTSYCFHTPESTDNWSPQSKPQPGQITVYPIPTNPESQLEPGETYKQWVDGDGDTVEAFRLPHHEIVQLADLMYQMLKYHPAERIETTAILRHEWFVSQAFPESPCSNIVKQCPVLKRKQCPVENKVDPPAAPAPKLRRSTRIAARVKALASWMKT